MSKASGNNSVTLSTTGSIVSANVQRARKRNGLSFTTLEDLTRDAGRRIAAISLRRIEDGTRRVDVDDLFALASALGLSPAFLLLGDSEQSPFGTAIPEDATFAEAKSWIQGTLVNFDVMNRKNYWQDVIDRLTGAMPALEDRAGRWADDARAEPDSSVKQKLARLARAEWDEAEIELATASKQLERVNLLAQAGEESSND